MLYLLVLSDEQVIGRGNGDGYRDYYCAFECPYCRNAQPLIKRLCTQLESHICLLSFSSGRAWDEDAHVIGAWWS